MIIKSMKLSNFRQFYGENELDFGTDSNNISLIIGANGNGKTGIFRALMFVLYGDKYLSQDSKKSNIHLVNLNKLDESNSPVEARVELTFIYNDQTYIMSRSITSIKDGNKIIDRETSPSLFYYTESGDYTEYSKDEIGIFINKIIDPEIREFFFFDAEKMNLLDTTKSDKALSEEIQQGIMKLLQIKYLDKAVNQLNSLIRKRQSEINKQVSDETLDNKINKRQDSIEKREFEQELEQTTKNELKSLNKEIEELEDKLNENYDIRKINDEIDIIKKDNELTKVHMGRIKKEMNNKIKESILFLSKDIMSSSELFFRGYIEESKDKIPRSLIEQSIEELRCSVCRTSFEEDSIQYHTLKKLIENFEASELTSISNNVLELSNKLRNEASKYESEVENDIKEFVSVSDKLEESEISIQKLQNKIEDSASSIENLSQYEKDLSEYKKKKNEIEEKLRKTTILITNYSNLIEELDYEIDKLTEKSGKVRKDRELKVKLQSYKETIEKTVQDYSKSITSELSTEMFKMFIHLIDSKDANNYKEIVINEKFEIKLFNQLGQNVIQDLSMGQGQIFALAFILSLAKLASKGRKEINFPLFMDTPFARLSKDNRSNLINNIPDLTNQWILLLTDTEYAAAERESFERIGRVGKIYKLNNIDGKTNILETNILP